MDECARQALRRELVCHPKPGLVSPVDAGSHSDMDAETFRRSIDALRGYFAEMAAAGAVGADFAALNLIGRRAEQRMYEATGGRNTHRGAVFSLGLLAAAAGRGALDARGLCGGVARAWGREMLAFRRPQGLTNGEFVRLRYGAPGAREEAASGFPTVLVRGLPALRAAEAAGLDANAAALHALFSIMAVLDDNNVLFRGGPEGLDFVRAEARAFLATGGMLSVGAMKRAGGVHRRFVDRGLSPGGAADLLAATLFVAGCEDLGRDA
ncbi:MAG: triphosphoribosyl-dephospho-CoA synthase MdcB [Azoarcus sp.]|nr:triphosphoribosyl-dephospho-CoA synthase MdcB [Azoarcus sp.]